MRTCRRSGVAALELAVLLPVLLMLLLGTWEVARVLEVGQLLTNAAREGGRQAATGQSTSAQARQAVLDYLRNAGVPTANAVVTVDDWTSPGTDAADAAWMDELHVEVSLPLEDVRWVRLYLVTDAATRLDAAVSWYSMRPQSYPTGVVSPAGF